MTDREDRIAKIIAKHLNIDWSTIGPNDALEGDLGIDSLDRFDLSMALEQEFDIPEETLDEGIVDAETVGDIYRLIEKAMA